ncbi:slipin family protein [Paenibacillus sp. JX-17]|uniref:Slipin family protein n=1 Tax=Paenibacillus lacisoli TaxID=3064525 RepID=A0ABT9CHP7_9BACL|nr:slipin family protein [Paenibacillus sp. JX-17]MDO7908797.1 slipin family protein [Paenibacillus sp. JX-17]
MFQKMNIMNDQRGLLYRKGSYVKLLMPGTYRLRSFQEETVQIMKLDEPFAPGKELNLYLNDPDLREQLDVVQVEDYEYVLHYEEGTFKELLKPGRYVFWKVLKEHRFVHVDIREPAVADTIDRSVLTKTAGCCYAHEVASYERGMLFYNNVFQKELPPGKYYFWKGPVHAAVRNLDLRRQQLDLIGQEMMTEDKITLRLNFVCQYRILDPMRALDFRAFEEQVYITLQLILREYVGTQKLDDLLRSKQEVAGFVLSRLQERGGEYGVQFLSAGVKDIILPGEIKDILNTVLLAEKKAQANLITRREETASTRSLLNTAKLMDENGTLYRLKELEFLEKICDRIGSISLTGGGNLLEQLNSLLSVRARAED